MAFPKPQQGRVDQVVTNILLAHKNEEFLADKILPVVPNLKNDSGIIGSIGNSHMRLYRTQRGAFDESEHRMSFEYAKDKKYQIEYYDLSVYLPDRVIEQAEAPFMPRRDAAFVTEHALRLEREVALAELMTDTSVLTQNVTLTGGDKFSDYANSNPEIVIENARDVVQSQTGLEANSAVMSRKVANTLKSHPFFLDLAKRNAGMNVSNLNLSQFVELFKAFFEIENVMIAKSQYISSLPGQPEVKSKVWADDLTIFHVPKTPSIMAPSFGYSFALKKNKQVVVRRHHNDKGEIVETCLAYDDNITDTNAAFLIKSAL